ncbi:MAG: VTT domain-containing protein [Burkholderiales bacterium]
MKSIFVEGKNCWRVANANRISFLVDAARYFDAFAAAAYKAKKSIFILGWDFDSQTRLWFEDNPRPWPAVLGDFLNSLARRKRRLRIYVLSWDFPMIYAGDRELAPVFGLPWHHHRRIHFRYDNHFPIGGSQHQKIAVIDDSVAFSGGVDLTHGRWDTTEHDPHDPRRTTHETPYPPFHDLMMAVDGEAAAALGDIARERWREAHGKKLKAVELNDDVWPDTLEADLTYHRVAISRTLPQYEGRPEVREVEQLYLDMIAAAKHTIYIENQYFTSSKVGDALQRRLQEQEGPEIILVLRLASDGWLEGPTMGALRTRLIKRLREADAHGRLHCYYPDVPGLGGACVNVHSKVMVVDDELLRIGSANLANRSMGLDSECDLTIEAQGDARVSKAIQSFRTRLLGEHLGCAPETVQAAAEQEKSLSKAIAKLHRSEGRTLATFDEFEEYSDAVVAMAEYTDLEKPVRTDELVSQFAPEASLRERGPLFVKLGLLLLLFAGLFAAWRYTPLKEYATVEVVTSWAETFSTYPAAPLLVIAAYVIGSIVFFPRTLLTLGTVLAFGPWFGFVYAMLGVLVAAFLTYYVGRLVSRDTVRRIAGEKINKITNTLRRKGLIAVVAVRMLPIAPFDIVNVVCGATRIKLWHFMVGTFIGMLPGMLAATVFGDQLKSAMGDGKINWWVVAVIALLFAASIFIARRYLFRGDPSQSPRPA